MRGQHDQSVSTARPRHKAVTARPRRPHASHFRSTDHTASTAPDQRYGISAFRFQDFRARTSCQGFLDNFHSTDRPQKSPGRCRGFHHMHLKKSDRATVFLLSGYGYKKATKSRPISIQLPSIQAKCTAPKYRQRSDVFENAR